MNRSVRRAFMLFYILVSTLWGGQEDVAYDMRINSVSRRNLLGNARFRWDDGEFTLLSESAADAEIDSLLILAVRVEFQEDASDRTTGNGRFDLSSPTEPIIDPPPHGREYFQNQLTALGNYYRSVSGGNLILTADVVSEIYTLPSDMEYYNPGTTEELVDKGLTELFRDAVALADADGIRFSDYDCFIVFHAGVGRDIDLGFDPTPSDIPSAFLNLEDLREQLAGGDDQYQGIDVEGGQYHVKEGIILPETESQEGYEVGLLGTMTLMFGFQLGLPALWNTRSGRSGIGAWGLMDQGSGNYRGLIPAEPCAWTKVFMGWETPVDTLVGTELNVACSKASNIPKIYRVPINDHEYFLIENRQYDPDGDGVTKGWDDAGNLVNFQPDGTLEVPGDLGVIVRVDEYDYGLPGSGILIWHVDEEVIIRNIVENRVNADRNHRGVDLEEADGAQDIGEDYGFVGGGAGSETGVMHDAWYADNDIHLLANNSDAVRFGPDTYPDSRSNSGANTHIVISDFSESDTLMFFTVTNDLLQAGFPQAFDPGGNPYPLLYGDLNGNGETEIVVVTDAGKLFVWDKNGQAVIGNDAVGIRVSVSGDTVNFPVALFVDAGASIILPPVLGDINDDGRDEVFAVIENSTLLGWSFDGQSVEVIMYVLFDGEILTDKILVDENLVLGTASGCVLAVEEAGETVWNIDLQNGAIAGMCRFGNDLVAVTESGYAAALNRSGDILWERNRTVDEGIMPPIAAQNLSDAESSIIVIAGQSEVVLLSPDGEETARFGSGILTDDFLHPAAGDIDGDGFWEVVLTAGGEVWGFNHNGSRADFFPFSAWERDTELSAPVLGDANGDGSIDILTVNSSGDVEGYGLDGTVLDGFPLTTGGLGIIPPALIDLDGDGDIEVAAISERGYLYVWDLSGAVDEGLVPWGGYRYDPAHTGLVALQLQTTPTTDALMPSHLVYNYPNPTEGNSTTIRYRLERRAAIRIKIFDLSGELVDEFAGPGQPQTENEVIWDLSDVDSGVYFCQVRAAGDGGEKVVTFKIGVVK